MAALVSLQEACDLLKREEPNLLDLLHVAITLGNLGYVQIQLKQYEEARSVLEETLLVSLFRLVACSFSLRG